MLDAGGQAAGAADGGFRQHQEELVLAPAADHVDVAADDALSRAAEPGQHLVAGLHAEQLVDILEPVQVTEDDGQVVAVADTAPQLPVEVVVQPGPGAAAGEGVAGGEGLDPRAQLALPADQLVLADRVADDCLDVFHRARLGHHPEDGPAVGRMHGCDEGCVRGEQ